MSPSLAVTLALILAGLALRRSRRDRARLRRAQQELAQLIRAFRCCPQCQGTAQNTLRLFAELSEEDPAQSHLTPDPASMAHAQKRP